MPEFRFDPPLTLKGYIVVRNFMIGYRETRRPVLQRVSYAALKEPPAKQSSAIPDTHFAAGQRQKTSSSNSTNKRKQHDASSQQDETF